ASALRRQRRKPHRPRRARELPLAARAAARERVETAMSLSGSELALNYLPRLPRRMDFRIGCIGAGFILRACHLGAYRPAGFNPVAIAARDPNRAQVVATQHGIPRCHHSIAELLADADVEILDIAVPPDAQPVIIRQAVEHKKHIRGILAQKPLALSYRDA